MIRRYEAGDRERLLAVWESASRGAHAFLGEGFLRREREAVATVYLPRAETWVCERDGVAIGFVALVGDEVGGLFVDPAWHGRGVGRALMDHVRSLRGVLELEVFEANARGRAFYERYGFRRVAERVHEETGHLLLRLRLDP